MHLVTSVLFVMLSLSACHLLSKHDHEDKTADANTVLNIDDAPPATEGFTLDRIAPGSKYEQIGLKEGDTILAINGQKLLDVSKAIKALNELHGQANATLTVRRNDEIKTIYVD